MDQSNTSCDSADLSLNWSGSCMEPYLSDNTLLSTNKNLYNTEQQTDESTEFDMSSMETTASTSLTSLPNITGTTSDIKNLRTSCSKKFWNSCDSKSVNVSENLDEKSIRDDNNEAADDDVPLRVLLKRMIDDILGKPIEKKLHSSLPTKAFNIRSGDNSPEINNNMPLGKFALIENESCTSQNNNSEDSLCCKNESVPNAVLSTITEESYISEYSSKLQSSLDQSTYLTDSLEHSSEEEREDSFDVVEKPFLLDIPDGGQDLGRNIVSSPIKSVQDLKAYFMKIVEEKRSKSIPRVHITPSTPGSSTRNNNI